ncbi:hypothetical protein GCM10027284_44160 [Cyclobacterium sediminis]
MATSESIAANLKEYNPILLLALIGDNLPRKPTPIRMEQMAVAGDILPELFAVNSSGIIILSMETNDKPRCSAKINAPIKIIV